MESVQCSGNRIAMGIGWHHLANGAVVCLCLAGMMEIGEAGSHLPFLGAFEYLVFVADLKLVQ